MFDVRTQLAAQREVAAGAGTKAGTLPPALRVRNFVNVVSCVFVLGLYVLMVVKPDFPLPFRPHGFAQRWVK
jgi:predicted secreted protein